MNRSLDVLVIGGAAIDYTIRGQTLPSPSHPVQGDAFLRDAGGKGLNQAVAAARLGARAALVACVGGDIEGNDVLTALKEDGVEADTVVRVMSIPTACTLIFVDARGQKQTGSYRGANLSLAASHVSDELLARAAVALAQLEIAVETVLETARQARRARALFVLDAAPAMDVPDELLSLSDIVCANREEAQALSRREVDDRDSAFAAARVIRSRGAQSVVVGAAEGRAVVGRDGEHWLPNHLVTVVDTTGAGDACAAAIAVGLAEKRSLLEACHLGHAAAALATTRLGARASLPFRSAVDALVAIG